MKIMWNVNMLLWAKLIAQINVVFHFFVSKFITLCHLTYFIPKALTLCLG